MLPTKHVRGHITSQLGGATIDIEVKSGDEVTLYTGVALLDDRSQLIDQWIAARDYIEAWKLREDRPRLQIVEFWGASGTRTSYVETTSEVVFLGKAGE